VLGSRPEERIYTTPPFLCVEILSPDDRANRMQPRIADYFAMGVEHVWVIDPETRAAWMHSRTEPLREVTDGILRAGHIEAPLAELFAD
jgi:Uma2 family endonuclease